VSKKPRLSGVLFHLAAIAVAALFVLPFYWALVASLRTPGLPPPRTVEWWPAAPHWDNYAEIFNLVPMGLYLRNSLFVVAIAVPLTLVVSSLAGFGLSQLAPRWRQRLVVVSIVLLMIPGVAVWTFRFHVLNWLGLVDSLWALIAPALAGSSPLFVLLFYWTYHHVPAEMYEAARLDGAGIWTVWWRVAQPLAWPTTAVVAMLTFVLYWSDFSGPVLYLFNPALYTMPVGLQILRQMDSTNYPLLMAGAVVMIAPVVALLALVQRFFLRDWGIGDW
jgi:multiple sugar transport system permease protein